MPKNRKPNLSLLLQQVHNLNMVGVFSSVLILAL